MTKHTNNITPLTLLSIVLAGYVLVVLVWIYHWIPIKPASIVNEVSPLMRSYFFLERDILFYRMILVVAIIIQSALVWFNHKQIADIQQRNQINHFLFNSAFWLFIQISAGLSIVFGQSAWPLFYSAFLVGILTQIFWPEIRRFAHFPAAALMCGFIGFIDMVSALNVWVVLFGYIVLFNAWSLSRWLVVPVLMISIGLAFKIIAFNLFMPSLMATGVVIVFGLARWLCSRLSIRIGLQALSTIWMGIGFTMLLIVGLIIPNLEAVIARAYIGEQLHHIDMFIMSPGWAALNHARIDVDQICQYGVGMPMVIAWLARIWGGFDYLPVLNIIVWGCIVYFILWFWLLRHWFASGALAMVAVVMGIAVQMFHSGVYPLIFTYPSTTVIRYPLDLIFFGSLMAFSRRGQWPWLVLCALTCGVSIFYMDSTGIALLVAFTACLCVLWMLTPTIKFALKSCFLLFLSIATALILFYLAVGPEVWTLSFWHHMTETAEYFISGIGNHPMHDNFLKGHFWLGLLGYLIPVVYVFTLLRCVTLIIMVRAQLDQMWMIALSVYGLGLYHYYIAHSIGTSFAPTILPFVFIVITWFKNKENWHMPLLVGAVVYLVSNPLWQSYPHLWYANQNPMVNKAIAKPLPDGTTYFNHLFRRDPPESKVDLNSLGQIDEQLFTEGDFKDDATLIDYYRKEYDFTQDANLIKSLTLENEAVPLISSFETRILMQAQRRGLFYYSPLLNSRPKHMRTLVFNFLHTSTQRYNTKALQQLEQAQSPFIFMEKVFLTNKIPMYYASRGENIIPIINYVHTHYVPYTYGEYLVAMKRKEINQ